MGPWTVHTNVVKAKQHTDCLCTTCLTLSIETLFWNACNGNEILSVRKIHQCAKTTTKLINLSNERRNKKKSITGL